MIKFIQEEGLMHGQIPMSKNEVTLVNQQTKTEKLW